jgi:hypothetical protein
MIKKSSTSEMLFIFKGGIHGFRELNKKIWMHDIIKRWHGDCQIKSSNCVTSEVTFSDNQSVTSQQNL